MKIARLATIPVQTSSQGILNNYFVVPDSYDFVNSSPAAVDVTSFDTLQTFMGAHAFDYQVFRDSLQNNLIPNWANILYTDRKRCVQHYKYPANISDDEYNSYFSPTDMEANWNMVCVNTRTVRLERLFAAFQKISYVLTTTQVAMIYMTTKQMLIDYYYGNLPHVIFWIQNGAYPPLGINFTTNGFQQISGYSPQLEAELLDILVNGNYIYTDTANITIQ